MLVSRKKAIIDISSILSLKDCIRQLLEYKVDNLKLFSLRSLAQATSIPASRLSSYLNGQSSLSAQNTMKLSLYLQLDSIESEYLMCLSLFESSKSSKLRQSLAQRIKSLRVHYLNIPHNRVKDIIAKTETHSIIRYKTLSPSPIAYRNIIRLKDKVTGELAPDFCVNFISTRRQVSCIGYFAYNDDGSYAKFPSKFFYPKVDIEYYCSHTQSTKIEFDNNGYPQIEATFLEQLSTSNLLKADINYSKKAVRIFGHSFDPKFPDKPLSTMEVNYEAL